MGCVFAGGIDIFKNMGVGVYIEIGACSGTTVTSFNGLDIMYTKHVAIQ